MSRNLFVIFALSLLGASLGFAQPAEPSPADVARLRIMWELDPKIQRAGEPWSIDPSSREAARQFFRAVYGASEDVPSGWNGDAATGTPGTTTAAFKEAVRDRVNFYRAYVGIPADITFNSTFSAKAQEAAVMSSANNGLSHNPQVEQPGWSFVTANAQEAAGKSNLALGPFGPDAIDGYIRDQGASNAVVGHRRWIFIPQAKEFGTGDVEAQNGFPASNTLWVNDGRAGDARPNTREEFVAWPPKGNVPYQLVWPRWSLTLPGANFTNASVSMTRNGAPISAVIEAGNQSLANEVTLVWLYDGKSGNSSDSHERPDADVAYEVTVSNVNIGGATRTFTYTVNVFDPDVPGNDFVATTIGTPSSLTAGSPSTLQVAVPSFAGGFQWRELGTDPNGNALWNAEGGLRGEIDGTASDYNLIVSSPTASGSGAYYLAHPTPILQTFTLPDTYMVPPSGPTDLTFDSKLGFSSQTQVARAEVSTNGGKSWVTVYEQRGTGSNTSPADAAYQSRSASLTPFAGRTIKVRFSYDHEGGSYFNQTDPSVGWLVDNVRLTNVMSVTPVSTSSHQSGTSFSYTPSSEGIKILQARGMFFGHYGMDWGPISLLTAQAGSSNNGGGESRIINLSVRASAASGVNALNVGMVIGGSGTKPLLVRVVGPTLGVLGVPGTAPDPALAVTRGGTTVATNDNWDGALSATFNQLGAFALGDNSADAAIDISLPTEPHVVLVDTQGQNGVVLVEAYDKHAVDEGSARLINVSARNQVGAGADVLVAGFVIEGSSNKTLLIRGVGATLADSRFNLPGVLEDPQLVINPLGSSTVIASNDNWDGDAQIAAMANTLGAFSLSSNADAALLVTLAPGAYTATVSGVNDTTGIAIVEVYEVN
ncbi:CAP domain-containing protein [Actomonas aquatica]|uniref:CAP domain-containing protein n=1 Tax=Actomonas aquatica TaxID=2866162 RepID=A0ABZ1C6F5_9BACT|nr:CAP domain-containing protein [Opitutus sp. WL0086]WRQ86843.1 CAP domain-containing protein [Opitutus sp. WL0086]